MLSRITFASNTRGDDDGYYFSTCVVRNFTAVAGSIMMTRTSLFKQLGGYTEALPTNFNDVDYCLKAKRAGYTTVYEPQAELIHYELDATCTRRRFSRDRILRKAMG